MKPGVLYLVATPIGNLADITFRAVDTLKSVDIVAAEDTRHSAILLGKHGIATDKLTAYHAHNLDHKTPALVKELLDGRNVALISDAGTPGISDPGAVLVKAAVNAGIIVCPIPGAAAPILAVGASGFPSHRFVFEGFLPRKKGRRTMILSWANETRTVIFFESPMRIIKTLREINGLIGNRKVCVARELTKIYEEFIRGDISIVADTLEKRGAVKGEITVVLAPENFGENRREEREE